MRLALALALAALAFATPALAGSGTCIPSCEVPSHLTLGFIPIVTVVERGSTVTWTAMDMGHTATSYADLAVCFDTHYTRSSPGQAWFTISDGKLFAISEWNDGALTECGNALALPDGSFSVDYTCVYHPSTMNGTLLIR
ncbi:MAG TPA: hypothetical protein VFH78_13115 [Candidatus Thermoplasmatota archaeon]|nr:hypothetical protein [Candidatus Thermoplasmatota archaeon]